jgi:putative ABC transport system permease protein
MPTDFLHDLRGGLRALRKSWTHTVVAVLTIALGIGLNTMMFSIVSSVVMRPLPFRDAGALVSVSANLPGLGLRDVGFSVPELDDLAQRASFFDQVTPVWVFDANLTGGRRPERVVMVASGVEYFSMLGAAPQLGRVFGPEDRADGFAEAVILSDAAWRRLFGGDPSAIGKQVRIDTDLYTIVGVMPPGFHHPAAAASPEVDVWSTAGFRANPFSSQPVRAARMLPSILGRLKPDVTPAGAQQAIDALATSIRQDHPGDYPQDSRWSMSITPLQNVVVGDVQVLLLALSAAVALVLLIGCANVANLLLARATTRHREIAIRLALGAGRSRLIRQLLTENFVLAAIGGAFGIVAAMWTQQLLVTVLPAGLPRVHEIRIDWIAVAFAVAITVITSLVCGLMPALQASRARPVTALTDVGRGMTSSRRQRRTRSAFVVAQIALSLVLVAGAGLLVTTVSRLANVDPGFNPAHVTAAKTRIALPNNPQLDQYRTPVARNALARNLLDHLRAIPDVTGAAVATAVPLTQAPFRVPVHVDGQTLSNDDAVAELLMVTPDYFSVLDIAVVSGRVFREADDTPGAPVAIIDEDAARRFFPGVDAVGRSIRIGRPGPQGMPPAIPIVGVVKTVKHDRLDEPPTPHVYASLYQRSGRSLSLFVKTRSDAPGTQEALRRAVSSVDVDLPVFAAESLEETVGRSISRQRFSAAALTAFAALALLLVSGGVYGVMAYAVTTRTRELGVRIAMGASPVDVLRGVLAEAMRTSVAGLLIGLTLAIAGARFIRTMLYGVSGFDPRIFAGAALILIASTMLAAYLPARRASRPDPLVSLRAE